jgi:hypothetical protein
MVLVFTAMRTSDPACSIGLWRFCINVTHNSGHYPSTCLLFKTQLYSLNYWVMHPVRRFLYTILINSIGLSVPHRKHITSPLRAQQLNATYRFVAIVCQYNYHSFGHHSTSCLLFKTRCFGDWILPLSWAQLSRFHLKTGGIQSAKRHVLMSKTVIVVFTVKIVGQICRAVQM